MSNKTVIIDYGMGNVASVQKALDFLKIPNSISNNINEIQEADFLILPGVGSFQQGMENLNKSGLVDALNDEVLNKEKPILGICLGMQLFAQYGTEPNVCNGLGWVEGKVEKIEEENLRIPHLGWNSIISYKTHFNPFHNEDFYFIHSYHFNIENKDKILATVNYGNEYVAAIQHKNVFATQFHPEKSQDIGLKMIQYFFEFYAKN